jgi:oligosaccharide reducing-end xylanase
MRPTLIILLLALTIGALGQNTEKKDCNKDVSDSRGKMIPWEQGAHKTGKYRNVFLDAGYSQADIDAKLAKAYYDVFEGPNRVYFEVGDSMGYVSDVKNQDARTEGLSYGLMVAVQLNKKDVFDRLWRWTKKYMQHQSGPREAYFAWSVDPKTGNQLSGGSASDGNSILLPACSSHQTAGATIPESIIMPKPKEYSMPCGVKMAPTGLPM